MNTIIQSFFGLIPFRFEDANSAAEPLSVAPDFIWIAALILLAVLIVAGFVVWKFLSGSNDKADFSSSYKDPEAEPVPFSSADTVKAEPELQSGNTLSAAETVSNNTDDDVVEELERPFSSEATVDAMGDASISSDDDDSVEDDS